jgi:L-ascorbate metabolism protein UlaG (beta-lactamase superfamily)
MKAPHEVVITYIGGPTCLIEMGGLRFLTDPTFEAGGEYTTGPVTLKKLRGPALSAEEVAPFDYVLLSHDHHFDNLDHEGRRILSQAKSVLTTDEGAKRLGGKRHGLKDWQGIDVQAHGCGVFRIVATPARHGPEGLDRGAVCGFVLFLTDSPEAALYISGDTVWYEGVAQVAHRFNVRLALLHLGAARVPVVGPFHLTMTAEEAVEASLAFRDAVVVPTHFEDRAHFSEGRDDIARAFEAAGLEQRLRWPERGRALRIGMGTDS